MLAYDKVKGDYSTYKLVRMDNVNVTGENFSKKTYSSRRNIITL